MQSQVLGIPDTSSYHVTIAMLLHLVVQGALSHCQKLARQNHPENFIGMHIPGLWRQTYKIYFVISPTNFFFFFCILVIFMHFENHCIGVGAPRRLKVVLY